MSIHSWKHGAIAALLLSSTSCLDPCGNLIRAETRSPDNGKRAVVFERDCGATTDFSTRVSILGAKERLPSAAGNVFIADSNHGVVATMVVRVRWNTPERIVISYPARARVFRKKALVNGIVIAYETQH